MAVGVDRSSGAGPRCTITPLKRAIPVRRTTLSEHGQTDELLKLTPSDRIGMMWQLALQAWMSKEGSADEPRLHRHVVRIVRGGR